MTDRARIIAQLTIFAHTWRLTTKAVVTISFYLLVFIITSCSGPEKEYIKISGATMATTYSVVYRVPQQKKIKPNSLKEDVDRLLQSIEQSMSTYRPNSELNQINRAALNTWIKVSPELYRVIEKSLDIHHRSQGAFDISVGPLVNRWGFGSDFTVANKPSDEEIAQLQDLMGLEALKLDPALYAVKKTKALQLDLSAIAKGYAVDALALLLKKNEIYNFLVEVGGELKSSGTKVNNVPWRVAIERPSFDGQNQKRSIHSIVNLQSMAIASSGDYRNFFKDDGKIYSHTIDPNTGKPVDHLLSSVTVLHTHCMDADALATAFMVIGPEKTLEYAEKHRLPVLMLVRTYDEPSANEEPSAYEEPSANKDPSDQEKPPFTLSEIMSSSMSAFIMAEDSQKPQ